MGYAAPPMSETPEQWMEQFSQAETPEQALSCLDSALALDAEYVPALGCKGTLLGQLQQHEPALECFDRLAELMPESGDAHNSRGLALQGLGRHEEAFAAFERAIEVAPKESAAYVNRGRLRDEAGQLDEALADYDHALGLEPDDPIALSNRGNTLAAKERFEEALASYERAIALDPEHVGAVLGRIDALIGLGRIDEANAARHEGAPYDRGPVVQMRRTLPSGRDLVLCYYPSSHSNPEYLEQTANKLLDYCAQLDAQGLKDGIRIGFMWSLVTLRDQGKDLVLCEPSFSRRPFDELSFEVSLTLQIAVMIQLLHSVTELPHSDCTFADAVAIAPGGLLEETLTMVRLHETNEQHISGWVIGATDMASAREIAESDRYDLLPTAALVDLRHHAIKTLSLPPGCVVRMERHRLVSVLDPQGKEVWKQDGPAQGS